MEDPLKKIELIEAIAKNILQKGYATNIKAAEEIARRWFKGVVQ